MRDKLLASTALVAVMAAGIVAPGQQLAKRSTKTEVKAQYATTKNS